MPVTSYYSVGGVILGERTDGGGRTNYGVDALGSVTSTLVGDAVVNRYSYKPYGAELSRSGAGADPSFRWAGSLGYRRTGRSHSEAYVRARHYDSKGGRWSTVDPLWPEEPQYGYAGGSPGVGVDPSGMAWQPLTMDMLRCMAQDAGIPDNNKNVGGAFEQCWQDAVGLERRNGTRFRSPWRWKNHQRRSVVPDFVGHLTGRVKLSVFYEVKAVSSKLIHRDYFYGQIGGMLDWLSYASSAATHPDWRANPWLVFGTTADTTLSRQLYIDADHPNWSFDFFGHQPKRKPVVLLQFKAEADPCRQRGGNIRWRFFGRYISCRLRASAPGEDALGGRRPGSHCNYQCCKGEGVA